jgi:hypothetical protein
VEVVDIRHMGIDIVAEDQVGLPGLTGEFTTQAFAEELAQDRNTQGLGRSGGTVSVGSIPRQGIPAATKFFSR